MKKLILISFFIILFVAPFFGQQKEEVIGKWTPEIGFSKSLGYTDSRGINFRLISPRFKLETDGDYWTEEEEKHPDQFMKGRFCFEMMYLNYPHDSEYGPIQEFSVAGNFLYNLLNKKRFDLDVIGGLRSYLITGNNFYLINHKKIYYWDYGLSAQFDLGFIAPFIDVRRFGYCTIGTEFRFHSGFLKPHKRYKAHKKLG